MRRFIPGGTKGQALVEYALGLVLAGFAATAGTMLLGPSIKAHIAADYQTTWPEVRFAGLNVVVNPTDYPTSAPTATSMYTATATLPPTATLQPSLTPTPTATLVPTNTSTSTPVPSVTPTPTSTPGMTYQQWCLSMGYTWRSFLQVCTIGWTVVTPPPP